MRRGVRAGLTAGVAVFTVGIGFGVLAGPVIGVVPAIVMSVVVFAGSAQLASVGVMAAGGPVTTAVLAGLLLNVRFLPMGIAAAAAFRGGWWRRAIESQALVDASWAIASDRAGSFDREVLIGATIPQAIGWWSGTTIGALGGSLLGHSHALGLDAIFPAFFLALLADQLNTRRAVAAALLGAGLAVLLIPSTPTGIPVAASAVAALLGLAPAHRRERDRPRQEHT